MPERALRIAFGFVLVLSGIKLVGVPAGVDVDHRGLARRRCGALVLACWLGCGELRVSAGSPLTDAGVESPGPWPGCSRRRSVVALLAATAVAFALTEGAKLEQARSPGRTSTRSSRRAATVASRSRTSTSGCGSASGSTVWIEDATATASRRSLPAARYRAARRSTLVVRRHLDDGRHALPDGVYMPVVQLERSHRTIALPNPIRLDTKPPRDHGPASASTRTSRPTATAAHDVFRVAYTLERARARDPARATAARSIFTRGQKHDGELDWNGKTRRAAVARARATTCSRSRRRTRPATLEAVPVRGRHRCATSRSARTRVVVAARRALRAPRLDRRADGQLAAATAAPASSAPHTLRLRAPKKPGVYRLYVTAAGHAAKALVVVGVTAELAARRRRGRRARPRRC